MFSDSMMLGGGRQAAFSIANSVRLDGVADYFTRTNSINGNLKTWTFSVWFKLSAIKDQILFSAIGNSSPHSGYVCLTPNGNLLLRASDEGDRTSSIVLRDTTSWYHLVWSYDSTNSLQRAWLNGAEITETFSPALAPTLNKDSAFNIATYLRLGRHYDPYDYYFGGYLAETILVDSAALDASHFGQTDPVTGSWRPKKVNIADYGTNGFHLDFSKPGDSGGTTNTTYAGGFGTYQVVINHARTLPNDAWITQIGVNQNSAESDKYVYILRDDGNDTYTVMWKSASFSHAGNGLQQVPVNYRIPTTGTYVMAVACPGSGLSWGHDTDLIGTMYRYSSVARTVGESFTAALAADVTVTETSPALTWTDGNLGNDVSGRGNHWTPASLGAADVVTDTPTNNYVLPNRLDCHSAISLSDGNRLVTSSTGVALVRMSAAIPAAGDWVVEMTHKGGTSPMVGVEGGGALPHLSNSSVLYRALNGNKYVDGLDSGVYGATYVENDVIGIVCNANTVTFYKNGVSQGTFAHGLSGDIFFACGGDANSYIQVNSGQTAFSYSYGSAKALCTAKLPKPVIQSPTKHFDVVTYTGTGAPQSITGLDFQPDFVWGKSRNTTGYSHHLQDVVRGWGNDLYSDLTSGEVNRPQLITSVSPTGFTLGTDEGMNESGRTYVAWCWKAGGAAVANTDGTITSQVSASSAAGFSIVTYTGTATSATVGHGLGVAPKLVIIKGRTNLGGSTMQWDVWHSALEANEYMALNSTSGKMVAANVWNGTAPDVSTITLGDAAAVNAVGDQYVAYCWAEVPGFSKFGSFTGNGSTDGPFVHCGFRPAFVLIKRSSGSEDWSIHDGTRDVANPVIRDLFPNTRDADLIPSPSSYAEIDFTASGFKLRNVNNRMNASGETYIFAAFAEAPFGGKKTTPAKAR